MMTNAVRAALWLIAFLSFCVAPVQASAYHAATSVAAQVPVPSSRLGETRTLLPDGRLLIVGGQNGNGTIKSDVSMQDSLTGTSTPLSAALNYARAWHTATVLPDGKVLIFGGIGPDGAVVSQAEVFDPSSETFALLSSGTPEPRAFHSATLLTDGRLWIAGGVSLSGQVLQSTQLWDPRQKTSNSSVTLAGVRRNHSSCLLPDGRVLIWGGKDNQDAALNNGEVFDPTSQTVAILDAPQALLQIDTKIAEVRASSPEDNATDVPVDALISLRFSRPLLMQSINGQTVVLQGPTGVVDASIVAAESGMLAFVTPKSPLVPATTYTVTFSGGTDTNHHSVAFSQFMFTTAGNLPGDDGWIPTSDWMTHRPDSKWQGLPPLQAAPGVTALAGQVLKLDGMPLPRVSLIIDGQRAFSDGTGRFLLKNLAAGHHSMMINATTANTRTRAYGIYEVGVDIAGGKTNVLKYTIWMTPLDTAHTVTIPSPTLSETVIKSPLLPGLELHIPANTVITGYDGRVITQINITPIPLDRPPFPLPNVPVPIYFTIQPGSSYIKVMSPEGPKGASLFYPNTFRYRPGTQFNFWNYDPDKKGWYVYGKGRVAADASQVIPNPGVVLYEFTGAMVANPNDAPPQGPPPAGDTDSPPPQDGPPATEPNPDGGEPVNLATGLFVYHQIDLTVSDVLPISLSRTYRQNDSGSRAFGVGTNFPYDIYLVGTNNTTPGGGYIWQDLILADGGRIHFTRTSPCTGSNGYCDFSDAVFENISSPNDFYGATIRWTGQNPTPWTLTKKDGTQYFFPDSDGSVSSRNGALFSMQDRYGNFLAFTRDATTMNLIQLTTTNGRWIKFTYDTSNRIKQAQDNIGRTVLYAYDAGGRLSQVTDANGGVTNYTYDAFNEMLTIQDPRGVVYLTNQYDSSGRVVQQTQADNSVFQFAYTTDPITGNITQTDVTDPRGTVARTTFNANGFITSQIAALGKPEQQTAVYVRDPNTNLLNSMIDPLQRETDNSYDAMGNKLSVTTMAKTSAAATTTFTYDPNFNRIATITDSLNHTITYQRDAANGNATAVVDALGHQTSNAFYPNGQLRSITDPMQNTVQFGQDHGDLVSTTDPISNVATMFVDGGGRIVSKTDAQGNIAKYTYDNLNHIFQVTDPKGGVTSRTYDAAGNLLSSTDPLDHTTTWTYDNMNRIVTRRDPLQRQESFSYDLNGNMTRSTDRNGHVTSFAYDALNRLNFVGFNTVVNGGNTTYESTVSYAYDAAGRLMQAVDSSGGSITKTYDDVNRLLTETTTQGSITYSFDSVGRTVSKTVAGQPAVNYTYDNANRLTGVSRGTASVGYGYDDADRRSSLTLPNGIVVSYNYDNDSHLTGLAYRMGANTLGTLTYSYDSDGRRTQVTGSLARTGLPRPVTSASYDAANELTNWDGVSISYDSNGNMLADSTNTFSWNARNQLAGLNGASLQYDASGRRIKNATGVSFLFDGGNATQELSGSTVTANMWTGGPDELFQRSDRSGAVVPLTDALGSTLALTDSSGNIQTTYTYDPFGNTSVSGQASSNPSQFTGRENDGNGLYYYRARYYNSIEGRFISEDPARIGGNFYAYAADSPTNLVDPSGLGPINWMIDKLKGPPPPPPPANFAPPKAPCPCHLDVNKMANWMTSNNAGGPTKNCGKSVRQGIQVGEGGVPTDNSQMLWPGSAKDYGPYLEGEGFVPTDDTDSSPHSIGDTVIQQGVPGTHGAENGHAATWNGTNWVSDFVQQNFNVYAAGPGAYVIYHYPCSCNDW
jgi:RHS repeat-associated protein